MARRLPQPVRDGIAIGVAVGIVGIAFGVLARSNGLSVGKTCAMSLLVFTGASQFAAVGVAGSGGSIGAALGSALLLGARNSLYGAVVARWFRGRSVALRVGITQLVIDESTGVGAAQDDADTDRPHDAALGFLATGLTIYVFWNLGTLVGALAGDLVGDTDNWGLDAAFPAAFVALLAPHLRERPGRVAATCAIALAIASLPLLPTGVPVLIAVLGVLPAAWLRSKEPPAEGDDLPIGDEDLP